MIDDDDGEDNKFSVIIKISLIFLMMVNTSLKRFWMVVKTSLKKFLDALASLELDQILLTDNFSILQIMRYLDFE